MNTEFGNKAQMQVTILGSGTCVPSLDRHPCSILVRIGTKNILVDAGPGTMGQLLKVGVTIDDLDLVLFSHFHLDHCAEMAPLLFATKYPGFDRKKKLVLAGGTGLKELYENLNHAYSGYLDMPDEIFQMVEFEETGQFDPELDQIKISYSEVCHRPESRAYRFEDASGWSVVYSGDTDYSSSLIHLSTGADILICECALPDKLKVKGHLTPSLAGEIAQKAGVKQLVLTHFYPECETADIVLECKATFNGTIRLASDLMVI